VPLAATVRSSDVVAPAAASAPRQAMEPPPQVRGREDVPAREAPWMVESIGLEADLQSHGRGMPEPRRELFPPRADDGVREAIADVCEPRRPAWADETTRVDVAVGACRGNVGRVRRHRGVKVVSVEPQHAAPRCERSTPRESHMCAAEVNEAKAAADGAERATLRLWAELRGEYLPQAPHTPLGGRQAENGAWASPCRQPRQAVARGGAARPRVATESPSPAALRTPRTPIADSPGAVRTPSTPTIGGLLDDERHSPTTAAERRERRRQRAAELARVRDWLNETRGRQPARVAWQ
jgi:hypothetical protein